MLENPVTMKKITELNLEELIERESKLKGILIAYGILGLIIFCLMIYLQAKPILFIPVCVLPIAGLPLIIVLKTVKEEIAKRKQANNSN